MKVALCAATLFALTLGSCSTTTLAVFDRESWPDERAGAPITLGLARPSVDRQTDASSIENEIERLAPLLFLKNGRPLTPRGGGADYLVDIRAVERELRTGWRGGRSVSVDLWVSRSDGVAAFALRSAPLAAFRLAASGETSLASSRDLYVLLSRGVDKLCRELDRTEKNR